MGEDNTLDLNGLINVVSTVTVTDGDNDVVSSQSATSGGLSLTFNDTDPTIAHYEPLPVPPSDPQAADILGTFIDRLTPPRPSAQGWVVLEGGQRVGLCQLRRTGEGHLVGVTLEAPARNRGLGTALFKALGDWGLRDGGFVAGEVEDDNVLSHVALDNAGYAEKDRYAIVLADGRPTMVTRYENL